MKGMTIVVLALLMSACVTTSHYGSFLPDKQQAVQVQIAEDAVKKLSTLYPPARSRFALQHAAKSTFGITLIRQLREAGFGIKEYAAGKADAENAGIALRYILDIAGAPDLYRLTLLVGEQSISRPYWRQDNAVVPAGFWARKE